MTINLNTLLESFPSLMQQCNLFLIVRSIVVFIKLCKQ